MREKKVARWAELRGYQPLLEVPPLGLGTASAPRELESLVAAPAVGADPNRARRKALLDVLETAVDATLHERLVPQGVPLVPKADTLALARGWQALPPGELRDSPKLQMAVKLLLFTHFGRTVQLTARRHMTSVFERLQRVELSRVLNPRARVVAPQMRTDDVGREAFVRTTRDAQIEIRNKIRTIEAAVAEAQVRKRLAASVKENNAPDESPSVFRSPGVLRRFSEPAVRVIRGLASRLPRTDSGLRSTALDGVGAELFPTGVPSNPSGTDALLLNAVDSLSRSAHSTLGPLSISWVDGPPDFGGTPFGPSGPQPRPDPSAPAGGPVPIGGGLGGGLPIRPGIPSAGTLIDQLMAARDQLELQDLQLGAQLLGAGTGVWGQLVEDVAGERPFRAIGVMDLFEVKEETVGFEPGPIADIRNMLPFHKTSIRTKETVVAERQTRSVQEEAESEETRTEKDTELSSSRNQQKSTVLGVDVSAGVDVTADYGVVKVDASLTAGFNFNQSTASETASELTERTFESAVADFSRSKLQEQSRRTTRSTEQETAHLVDTTAAKSPLSALRYEVHELKRMRLKHKGKRLLVHFVIPEPGIRLLALDLHESPVGVDKPPMLPSAGEITSEGYPVWASRFGIELPSPPPWRTVVRDAFHRDELVRSAPPSEDEEDAGAPLPPVPFITATRVMAIPSGYRPYTLDIAWAADYWKGTTFLVDGQVAVDAESQGSGGDVIQNRVAQHTFDPSRSGSSETVALSLFAREPSGPAGALVVNASLVCHRETGQLVAWQLECLSLLREAHDRMSARYQAAQAAAAQAAATNQSSPLPADQLRQRARDELRKWSVQFLLGGQIAPASLNQHGEPSRSYAARLHPIQGFFEGAFEWENATISSKPYFYGSRDNWKTKLTHRHVDLEYERFLRGGSADFFVPVRPGSEELVARFLEDPSIASLVDLLNGDASPTLATDSAELVYELLATHKHDATLASGSLAVVQGSADVTLSGDSLWTPNSMDIGREVLINLVGFTIEKVAIGNVTTLTLDKPVPFADGSYRYGTGSVFVGKEWLATFPTGHTIYASQLDKLWSRAKGTGPDSATQADFQAIRP